MNGPVLRVAWYRFRATFRRRLGGYLTLAVLIGLVGGVAMGSMVAARRPRRADPPGRRGGGRGAGGGPPPLCVLPEVPGQHQPVRPHRSADHHADLLAALSRPARPPAGR